MQPVRGPISLENMQTGDGRVIAAGAFDWPDGQLPLAWIVGGDQHIDLVTAAPVVGNMTTIERQGDVIYARGMVDDSTPEGAELVRRMRDGSAPLGNRWPVSVDPDNWEVQLLVAVQEGEEEQQPVIIMASATPGEPLPTRDQLVERLGSFLVAAAGEPDPGEDSPDYMQLFTDSVDEMLARYTRLRIRGATFCSVAAFDGAWMELDPDAVEQAPATGGPITAAVVGDVEHAFTDPDGDGYCDQPMTADTDGNTTSICGMTEALHNMLNDAEDPGEDAGGGTVTASVVARVAPPADWFAMPEPEVGSDLYVEQPDGGLAVPLTITDDGRVFGHLARWGQCHTGYPGDCVTAPASGLGYSGFHVGHVRCADGTDLATGVLTIGCDHAAAHLRAPQARDHYANTGLGWSDVRAVNGQVGCWIAGALRPGIDAVQLRDLRASALSGDWRPIDGRLELVAALSVNSPGFPIARETSLAASSAPRLTLVADDAASLVAAGMVYRCPDCAARAQADAALQDADQYRAMVVEALSRVEQSVSLLERRTRHLVPDAARAVTASLARQ